MKLFIVDQEGLGLDLAIRAEEWGHDVLWLRDCEGAGHGPARYGDGYGFRFADDIKQGLRWVGKQGLVWMSGNAKHLKEIDRWREFGVRVFGPTSESAKWETDREVGMRVLEEAGIDLLPYETFDSLQGALAFARKAETPHVFKPMGDEEDKSLTFVPGSPEELVGWLERMVKKGKKLRGKCMLQERVDVCCGDYGADAWVGPNGFSKMRSVSFEHKKLMDGERGPNTGEMGTVMAYVKQDRIFDEVLMPLEEQLVKTGHTGSFSVGVVIDEEGKAWPLEFTCRPGWPIFYMQTSLHEGDPVQWMSDLVDGEDTLRVSREASACVVMAQPKWPYNASKPEDVEGNPITGIDDAWPDVHPAYVMLSPEGDYQTTNEYVCVVTGSGETVSAAREAAYENVEKIKFADSIYRSDIGEKLEGFLPDLHGHGYATEVEYE